MLYANYHVGWLEGEEGGGGGGGVEVGIFEMQPIKNI